MVTVTMQGSRSPLITGALIGAGSGLVAGLLVGLIDSSAGHALAGGLGLAVPLGLAGAGFELLAARRVVRPAVFATVALFWLVAFPLARLVHEVAYTLALSGRLAAPDDVLAFLAFQGLVSAGYAIGFLWLRERLRRPRS
ncbi:hypothetical protein J2S43_001757 [Catenuloplanes nepalensis]|uniref:Uncharacterized protein n=1 Tax=Catenuloplanes nepalensis TaxID=587533 RepID=A0ABT9MP99_9ACTN|nr:hypothetical protein [Catenuloplanes nepalensis]MDP9793245.1 hypothetical protein [Catenuloplanes nepalensis]